MNLFQVGIMKMMRQPVDITSYHVAYEVCYQIDQK